MMAMSLNEQQTQSGYKTVSPFLPFFPSAGAPQRVLVERMNFLSRGILGGSGGAGSGGSGSGSGSGSAASSFGSGDGSSAKSHVHLLNQIATSALPEDRRKALLDLRALVKESHASHARIGSAASCVSRFALARDQHRTSSFILMFLVQISAPRAWPCCTAC